MILRLLSLIKVMQANKGSITTLSRINATIPITVIGIVALILLKVVMDPLLACMTLISDSSLSIIQRLASVIVPATTVSWIHNKKKPQIEMKEMEDVEARISDLEIEIKLVRNAMIKNGNTNMTK